MRRAFSRKAWVLSLSGALLLSGAVVLADLSYRAALRFRDLGEINRRTLERISCHQPGAKSSDGQPGPSICDIGAVENDPDFVPSDYVLTRQTQYFIYNGGRHPGFWLNFSDVAYLQRFRKAQSEQVETGETWRLYSRATRVDGKTIELMVAHLEYAPSRLVQCPGGPAVDEELRREADKIAGRLGREPNGIAGEGIKSRADAWQVVDGETGRVLSWSADVPARYPKDLDRGRRRVHFEGYEVWLVRSAKNDDLEAISLASIGDVPSFVMFGLGIYVVGFFVIHPIVKRSLRSGIRRPTGLEEALNSGESEHVEFKREVRELQQFLKDVTAFANSVGGTVFIGVADNKDVVGIGVATPQEKDRFERRVRDSVRQGIEPSPDVEVDFEEKERQVVARVFVRAGWQRHSFEGRYYVRRGSQSVFLVDGEIDSL